MELNCGHYTGRDEWVNALSFDKSTYTVPDGAYMADGHHRLQPPIRCARRSAKTRSWWRASSCAPNLSGSIPRSTRASWRARQAMRDTLGIDLAPEVLPLSNLNAAMFPFMLDLNTVFALQEA